MKQHDTQVTVDVRPGRFFLLVVFLYVIAGGVSAAERTALKVCADGNNMPFSNKQQEGFENRIADLFGEKLGLPVEYTFFPQRMGFIRNTLRNQLEHGGYKCDLVVGVPENFQLAATTKPYYRSHYVLSYIKGRGFDSIRNAEDAVRLPDDIKDGIRFGLYDRGPAQLWVHKNDLMSQAIPYQAQPGDTRVSVGEMMDRLIDNEVNMTIIWGPFAGWWRKKTDDVEIVNIPLMNLPDEPEMRFEFNISMAVRYGDMEWKERVNKFIDNHRDEIQAILDDYNIPTISLDQEI